MEKQSASYSRAWNPVIIGLLSFLFTFLPGGIFYALNFEKLGKPEKKNISLVFVIVGFFIFTAVVYLIPKDVPTVPIFTLINAAVSGYFIYSQKKLYSQYLARGGEKASILPPVLLSLVWFIFILILFFFYPSGEPSELDLNPEKAFIEAAHSGNIDIVKSFIERGIDINVYYKGRTALFEAAMCGKKEILLLLLKEGADADIKDQDGLISPLYMVAMENRGGYEKTNEIIKILVDGGADINTGARFSNITPLMWLARNGNIEGVKYLVEKGSDISIKDEDGQTAIDYAKKNRHTDIEKYLTDILQNSIQ